MKLRKKITSTVQVLTHLKEKLQFVQAENQVLKGRLRDVEDDAAKVCWFFFFTKTFPTRCPFWLSPADMNLVKYPIFILSSLQLIHVEKFGYRPLKIFGGKAM